MRTTSVWDGLAYDDTYPRFFEIDKTNSGAATHRYDRVLRVEIEIAVMDAEIARRGIATEIAPEIAPIGERGRYPQGLALLPQGVPVPGGGGGMTATQIVALVTSDPTALATLAAATGGGGGGGVVGAFLANGAVPATGDWNLDGHSIGNAVLDGGNA